MYQCKVDVDMLKAVKSVLADVLSISPSSKQKANFVRALTKGLGSKHQPTHSLRHSAYPDIVDSFL